ncbi:MAG: WcaI family glycosyltransferase [Parvibaculum sp.]|nr:WcaI family glycosyltransferase [Parvibaculum sp.]
MNIKRTLSIRFRGTPDTISNSDLRPPKVSIRKRIAIYGINYAPEIAGVGRYTGEIGDHLAQLGHQIFVVTAPPHYPGWKLGDGYTTYAWTREKLRGVDIYRCPLYLHRDMKGFRRLLAPFTFALSSAAVAFFEILRRRPHVVIAVEPTLFVAPVALLASKIVGAKSVLHVQDLEIDAAFAVGHLGKGGIAAKVAERFEKFVVRRFDQVITISNRMADKLLAKGVSADHLTVVRNWVDVEQIKPQLTSITYREELGLKRSDFVVLYSGNLGAKQGMGLLLDAARELAPHTNVVFVIAGQGPMRRDLECAAETMSNIRVFDFQPEHRFCDFLSVADVHILPQERQAADLLLPSKLGGMLASGRRVIVTADEGTELADFLGASCVLSPPGDSGALAAAVLTAMREEPCPHQEKQRLELANGLSKQTNIEIFTRAALFSHADAQSLKPAQHTAQN